MPKPRIFERELRGDGLLEAANIGTEAIKADWGLITVLHSIRAHLKRCNLKAHCSLPTQLCVRRENCCSLVHLKSPVRVLLQNSWQKSHEVLSSENAWLILKCFEVISQQLEKIELELVEHSLIFAFCNSPEVGSLHFATLTFLKRTSYFPKSFLMPFIFCPAKIPLLHTSCSTGSL